MVGLLKITGDHSMETYFPFYLSYSTTHQLVISFVTQYQTKRKIGYSQSYTIYQDSHLWPVTIGGYSGGYIRVMDDMGTGTPGSRCTSGKISGMCTLGEALVYFLYKPSLLQQIDEQASKIRIPRIYIRFLLDFLLFAVPALFHLPARSSLLNLYLIITGLLKLPVAALPIAVAEFS